MITRQWCTKNGKAFPLCFSCTDDYIFNTLKNAGLFQPKFGSNMDKPYS